MKVKVELHTHSQLSACCSEENTLNNLVNLGAICGTQILALSDHNSCLNFPALDKLCKEQGLLAVPAMEITTEEEIHLLCLFKTYNQAKQMADKVFKTLPKYELNYKFYNHQNVLNEKDEVIGEIPNLLNVACGFDIYQVVKEVNDLDGMVIPAHIDRDSNSILSVLGAVPEDLDVKCVEITPFCSKELRAEYEGKYNIICSSDAHCLEDLCKNEFYLDLDRLSINALFERLKR